jgi:hypothetical protein
MLQLCVLESGNLERPAKVTLAKGERQRDRVLTDGEWQQYIVEMPAALARCCNHHFAAQGCALERFSRFAGKIST